MPKKIIQIILYLGLGIVGIILIIMGLGLLLEDHWAHLKHLIWVVGGVSCLAAVFPGIERNLGRPLPSFIKYGATAGLSIIVFMIVSQMVQIEKARTGEVKTINQADVTYAIVAPVATIDKETIQRELKNLDDLFPATSDYYKRFSDLSDVTDTFNAYAELVAAGTNNPDPDVRELIAQLKSRVSAIQIREFPKLRRKGAADYANGLKDKTDITVFTNGDGDNIINLSCKYCSHSDFALTIEKGMRETFARFRFKESRYRQYKGQTDYISYPHHTPADAEVVPYILGDEN